VTGFAAQEILLSGIETLGVSGSTGNRIGPVIPDQAADVGIAIDSGRFPAMVVVVRTTGNQQANSSDP
jgi:hypothetical protein